MSVLTGRAEVLARQLHEGHIDKNGAPIIEHVVRVVEAVRSRCLNDETAEAGPWLHSAVEDAACSLTELASEFPPSAVAAVDAISHRPAENPDFYLYRVIDNPVAHMVKLAVIDDDLDPMRVTLLNPMVRRRLLDKNGYARDRLLATSRT